MLEVLVLGIFVSFIVFGLRLIKYKYTPPEARFPSHKLCFDSIRWYLQIANMPDGLEKMIQLEKFYDHAVELNESENVSTKAKVIKLFS